MSSLNDSERELHQFRNRIAALVIFILVCFFFLLLRFIWVQIVRHSNYVAQAEENRISIVPTMPSRGIIMDRNGVILANNYSAYTLEITPAKIGAKLEDVIEELSQIIEHPTGQETVQKNWMEETKTFRKIVLKAKLIR